MLEPGAFREPHWHPNAHELTYCFKGYSLVTVFSNGNCNTFTIAQGEMLFVPSGYLHAIANIGGECAEFVIAFSLRTGRLWHVRRRRLHERECDGKYLGHSGDRGKGH